MTQSSAAHSWLHAYFAFLKSKDENLILKAAPILLVVGTPEVLLSNLLPFVGETLDIGTFGLTAIVLFRTFRAVRKYR